MVWINSIVGESQFPQGGAGSIELDFAAGSASDGIHLVFG
jgi:hypothetical protein